MQAKAIAYFIQKSKFNHGLIKVDKPVSALKCLNNLLKLSPNHHKLSYCRAVFGKYATNLSEDDLKKHITDERIRTFFKAQVEKLEFKSEAELKKQNDAYLKENKSSLAHVFACLKTKRKVFGETISEGDLTAALPTCHYKDVKLAERVHRNLLKHAIKADAFKSKAAQIWAYSSYFEGAKSQVEAEVTKAKAEKNLTLTK